MSEKTSKKKTQIPQHPQFLVLKSRFSKKKKQIHGAMPPPAPWLEQETPPVLRLEGAWAYNACVQKNMGVFHGGSPIAGCFINVYNGKPHRKTRLAKFNQLEVSPINWGLSFQTYIKSPTPTG